MTSAQFTPQYIHCMYSNCFPHNMCIESTVCTPTDRQHHNPVPKCTDTLYTTPEEAALSMHIKLFIYMHVVWINNVLGGEHLLFYQRGMLGKQVATIKFNASVRRYCSNTITKAITLMIIISMPLFIFALQNNV
jgi:hypothetical protein